MRYNRKISGLRGTTASCSSSSTWRSELRLTKALRFFVIRPNRAVAVPKFDDVEQLREALSEDTPQAVALQHMITRSASTLNVSRPFGNTPAGISRATGNHKLLISFAIEHAYSYP